MKYKRKKRALTLLEIMIVIALIATITAVVGYNMKGSLEKGKAFRTKQAQSQLEDMFQLALSEGEIAKDILDDPKRVLKRLNLAKNPEQLLKDGWGVPFELKITRDGSTIVAKSERLIAYEKKHRLGTAEPSSSSDVYSEENEE